MANSPVGIDDIALFLPETSIDLTTVVQERSKEDPEWERRLTRALGTTGQKALRFPRVWEDSTTMAAQACLTLVQKNPTLDIQKIRYLALGTETSVDMSKAGSSYVLGLLEKASVKLPKTLSTFQIQHACAGGTLALLSTAGLLSSGGRDDEKALVMTSDIARYKAPSTAEVTQGAGAAAILVSLEPRLIEMDLSTLGLYSSDVGDFFRPLGSTIAMVKGSFSVQCYTESLIGAFEDHCQRAGVDPSQELNSIDLFALHIPYAQMPLNAMEKLLEKFLGLDSAGAREFLKRRGFFASLEPTSMVGNLYTGSLYLGLAYSLKERMGVWAGSFPGKKILFASYGSGNTMAVFTGFVSKEADKVVKSWQLDEVLKNHRPGSFQDYLGWLNTEKKAENYAALLEQDPPAKGRFYLENLREDGYREYQFR